MKFSLCVILPPSPSLSVNEAPFRSYICKAEQVPASHKPGMSSEGAGCVSTLQNVSDFKANQGTESGLCTAQLSNTRVSMLSGDLVELDFGR